ncbi:hypothetical protein [Nostoc sp.]|uniref:hypothetical protein n=1 Tax=Nostoc sp. TaxID=1180 RepID=UPI002FF723E5
MTSLRLMHKAKKKQLRSWLRIRLIGCPIQRLTTPTLEDSLTLRYQPPHSLINLAVDIGRRCFRHPPAIHPRPVEGRGIPPN